MNSRIHPNFKTKYRVTNWASYDRALVQRGDITIWITPAAIKAWKPRPTGKRGAPRKYSDLAIEAALTLHLGVDRSGMIHAQVLTDSTVDDASTGVEIIKRFRGKLSSVTRDGAYDSIGIYEAAGTHGAKVIVPPSRSATVSGGGQRSATRDRTIKKVEQLGRRKWKKESGYHRQGTVENTFFRFKSMLGDRLHTRGPAAQEVEVAIGCRALNRMFALGQPKSKPMGR